MRSSVIHNVELNLASAAVVLGVTEGELYYYYQNKPPAKLSLYTIDLIRWKKLNNGSYDFPWYESELANKDPIILHDIDTLLRLIASVLLTPVGMLAVLDLFKLEMPKDKNLGHMLEALRVINRKYPDTTGELPDFMSRLSKVGFFKLAVHDCARPAEFYGVKRCHDCEGGE